MSKTADRSGSYPLYLSQKPRLRLSCLMSSGTTMLVVKRLLALLLVLLFLLARPLRSPGEFRSLPIVVRKGNPPCPCKNKVTIATNRRDWTRISGSRSSDRMVAEVRRAPEERPDRLARRVLQGRALQAQASPVPRVRQDLQALQVRRGPEEPQGSERPAPRALPDPEALLERRGRLGL